MYIVCDNVDCVAVWKGVISIQRLLKLILLCSESLQRQHLFIWFIYVLLYSLL